MSHRFASLIAIAFLITLVVGMLAWWSDSPTRTLNTALTNTFTKWQMASLTPRDDIIIVAIDDATLADPRFGRWQEWRRSYFAEGIDALAHAGVRVIGVDVVWSEPSHRVDDDARLATSIRTAGNVVLVGRYDGAIGPTFPIDAFAEGAGGLGFANVETDTDAVVRRSFVTRNFGTYNQPFLLESFALQLARQAGFATPTSKLPTRGDRTFGITFFGKPHTYRTISFVDVVDGKWGDIKPSDAIALIGVTPPDLRDTAPTPTTGEMMMPGVEIHANALQTILDGRMTRDVSIDATLILIGIYTLIGALYFGFAQRVMIAIITLVIVTGMSISASYAIFRTDLIIDIAHPLIALSLTFIGVYLYRYITVDHQKRHLKRAFAHYVAPALVEKISDDASSLRLGGEKRELTVFFSDLQNFTSLSEHLTPEDLVKLLNTYLGRMTDIVIESGGTLDKYIGDAVMAFWNAPLPHDDHAIAACRSALQQQKAVDMLQNEGALPTNLPLVARMGIHTGPCIVGNMGSATRFNYTAMGDAVNLASRLEGVNKLYGTRILISDATYAAAKDAVEAREIDTICVKGKEMSTTIYELIGMRGDITPEMRQGFERYTIGLAAYRAGEWDMATAAFHTVHKILPDDHPSTVLLARIETLRKNGTTDWHGVYTLHRK